MNRFLVLLVLAAAGFAACGAEPVVTTLEPFSTIRSCLPFNLLIKPSEKADEYSLTVDADESVSKVMLTEVKDGVLALGTTDGFNVTSAIKVFVSLPKDKLAQIEKSSASDLVVADGFEVDELQILVNGLGVLIVRGITADKVILENTQIATVSIEGVIKSAKVSSAGTSRVFLQGVTNDVEVSLSGISKVFVDGASDSVKITGKASGLAQVLKTKGKCEVKGDFFLRSACSATSPNSFQSFVPEYSCGMLVGGGLPCTAESASESTFLSTGTSEEGTFSFGGGSAFGRDFIKEASQPQAPTSTSVSQSGDGSASASAFGFGSTSSSGSGEFSTLVTTTSTTVTVSSEGSSSSSATATSEGEPSSAEASATPGAVDTSTSGQGAVAVAVVSQACIVDDRSSLKML